MFTWTDAPLSQMWQYLRYLASPANVYNLLSGKTSSSRRENFPESEELQTRAFQIAACVRQADEYYRAAGGVGMSTKPLLLFYGGHALAKAVVLANRPEARLEEIKYHGLSTRPISKELEDYRKGDARTLELEFAITKDGLFPLLCLAVGDITPRQDNLIIFSEVLRITPDLSDLYARHYGEPSHCRRLVDVSFEERLRLRFSKWTREDAVRAFPELGEFEYEEERGWISFRSPVKELPDTLVIESGTVAGDYLVRRHHAGFGHSLPVLFSALFILSNLVRYDPDLWVRTIDGGSSGSIAMVDAVCGLANRRLPNDALEAIWSEKYTYATPAYLS